MKEVSIKGIIIGFISLLIIDGMLGDYLLTYLMTGDISSEMIQKMYVDNVFLVMRFIIALVALTAAGYITTLISKSTSYINSAVVGILALMLTTLAYSASSWPMWFGILSILTQVPATLLGTWLTYNIVHKKVST
ncbi:MAG: hypothetical protein HRT52_18745 [Colwellia sp.]|nr:hypothetical protein [Colwellia sp.]